jgi:hypothetical protein
MLGLLHVPDKDDLMLNNRTGTWSKLAPLGNILRIW